MNIDAMGCVVVVVVVVLFNWVFGFFGEAPPRPAERPRARADRRWRGGGTERFRGSLLKVAKIIAGSKCEVAVLG